MRLPVFIFALVAAGRIGSADPSPTPDPAVKTLSDQLIAAPDAAARDALLACLGDL